MANSEPKGRVLIVDDDEILLRMLAVSLGKRGYEVIGAATGEEGFALALSAKPDIVVLDVMLPDITGWTFIKRLRSNSELLFVPVIFLSALADPKSRVQGFSLGADDYLTKPFRLEELGFRIARSFDRLAAAPSSVKAQVEVSKPRQSASLHGRVADIGLSAILLLLEMERKSGALEVNQIQGDASAKIVISGGSVFYAWCKHGRGGLELRNAEAVYHVLGWGDATFEFVPGEVDAQDEVRTPTSHLLMEAARLQDEREGRDVEFGLVHDD